jgi:hypothetical protein
VTTKRSVGYAMAQSGVNGCVSKEESRRQTSNSASLERSKQKGAAKAEELVGVTELTDVSP